MRESGHTSLLRLFAATGLVIGVVATQGCSDDGNNQTGSTSSSSGSGGSGGAGGTGGSGGTAGTGGTGGTAGAGGMMGVSLDAAATDALPFDATPDLTGDKVYITGLDSMGEPAIFAAKMDGSAPSTALWAGDPLVSPLNIATSTDGMTLYVADPGAEDGTGDAGRIFSLPAAGGMPTALTAADAYRARGLEVMSDNGKDIIYFAGTDAAGVAGIFKVPADGSGGVTAVATGDPFRDPSGVAVASNGDVYACDTVQDGDSLGSIIAVKNGVATALATAVRAGFPCGVALTSDESTLLISAIDAVKRTDIVIILDLATNGTSNFSQGIDTYVESAGLHRAKQGGNTFAWADSKAGTNGTVFRVVLP